MYTVKMWFNKCIARSKREQKGKEERRTPKSNNSESLQDVSFFAEDLEFNSTATAEDLASVDVKPIGFARLVNFSSNPI